MRVIPDIPDFLPIVIPNRITEYKEKLADSLRNNYTLTDGYLSYCCSFSVSNLFCGVMFSIVDNRTDISRLFNCLSLAAARDSAALLTLLLEFITKTNIRNSLTRVAYALKSIGYIIASRSSDQAKTITEILLEITPENMKEAVYIVWLIYCVCGGVCGVEVISLILKSIKWDEEVKNVIIGLLINTWDSRMGKEVCMAILQIVPCNKLGTCLTTNFDDGKFPYEINNYFSMTDGSILVTARKKQAENDFESCLSSTQLTAISDYVKSTPNSATVELLALGSSHLADYCIPNHPQAKLQMYCVVCFNEFEGNPDFLIRGGASTEAEIMIQSFSVVGVKMSPPIKNWTTYSLFSNLRKFCSEIRNSCSLAVVCIMTHGKAGLLYACEGSVESHTDCCKINDILYILGEELPHYIPKVSSTDWLKTGFVHQLSRPTSIITV